MDAPPDDAGSGTGEKRESRRLITGV